MNNTYTEAEARRKYCPLKDNAGCVGSYCMKWSWYYNQEITEIFSPPKFIKTDKGYCEL